ncbi:MAG: hypothetical protein P4L53_06330 [Candidatus Obscuribacterales bacterium]|nr:hypothetical protein [Candidatus Obscuribacterales bacterium]
MLISSFDDLSQFNIEPEQPLECRDYIEEIEQLVDGQANVRLMEEFIPDEKIQTVMNANDVVFPYRGIMTSGAFVLNSAVPPPAVP